jgi:hypothetical protein
MKNVSTEKDTPQDRPDMRPWRREAAEHWASMAQTMLRELEDTAAVLYSGCVRTDTIQRAFRRGLSGRARAK